MRAIFGLVSLLVVIAIIAWMFSIYSIPVAKTGKKTQVEVRQMSGHDEDGTPADRTITLDAGQRNGKFQNLEVTSVVPGGAMDRFYGFQPGDKIIGIGGTDIATLSNDDFEMAKAMLLQEGYEKKKPVTVIRNGVQMQLPNPAAAAASSGATPAAPANSSDDGSSKPKSISDQLKAIGAGQE